MFLVEVIIVKFFPFLGWQKGNILVILLVSFLNLLNLVASNVCFAMFYLFPLIINQSINYLCMCFSNNVLDSYFVHLLASLITRFVFLFLFCF